MSIGPGEHSPVGMSAAKRIIACSLSVSLSVGIEDEESDHAALGTAVHTLIEGCFSSGKDAWEYVGRRIVNGYILDHDREIKAIGPKGEPFYINKAMANAAQVMLDAVRKAHPDRNQGNFWVERRFHCPSIHPLFYGTSDVVFLEITADGRIILHIWDYKNGAGVVVEVVENDQAMGYACGALEDLDLWDKVDEVVLHIVQPNGFHYDGPVRSWSTTAEHLAEWLETIYLPAVELAVSGKGTTVSGEHCRFCPARTHACPQLMSDIDELEVLMEVINTKGADALTGEQLTRFLNLKVSTKIAFAAAESTAFKRIQGGARIDGWKLAKAKANREWKEGADAAAMAEFGNKAMTEPKAKSPAQIDDLPMGTDFTARWAYKPDTGLTLVKGTDNRPEVSTDTKSLFTPVAKLPAAVTQPIVPPPASGRRKTASLSIVQ